jgi:hypothetical protein
MVKYIDGEVNVDYKIVRNSETMPKGARKSAWGIRFPGQGADGYGNKISTDLMVQFRGEKRKYRVYCACFSNCGSNWIVRNGQPLFLRTVFLNSDISETFYE